MNNNELAAKCLIEAAGILSNNNMDTMTEGLIGKAFDTRKKYKDIIDKFNAGNYEGINDVDKENITKWVYDATALCDRMAKDAKKDIIRAKNGNDRNKISVLISTGIGFLVTYGAAFGLSGAKTITQAKVLFLVLIAGILYTLISVTVKSVLASKDYAYLERTVVFLKEKKRDLIKAKEKIKNKEILSRIDATLGQIQKVEDELGNKE
jgi:hypothetical protein